MENVFLKKDRVDFQMFSSHWIEKYLVCLNKDKNYWAKIMTEKTDIVTLVIPNADFVKNV